MNLPWLYTSLKKRWLYSARFRSSSSGCPKTWTMQSICSSKMDIVTFEKFFLYACVWGFLTYHLEHGYGGEQVFPQEEVSQGAAHSPYINSLSDGEAQRHFWSSREDRETATHQPERCQLREYLNEINHQEQDTWIQLPAAACLRWCNSLGSRGQSQSAWLAAAAPVGWPAWRCWAWCPRAGGQGCWANRGRRTAAGRKWSTNEVY